MKILILHSQAEVRDKLAFPLESGLAATSLAAPSGAEAKAIAEAKQFVPTVIVAENVNEVLNFWDAGKSSMSVDFALCESSDPNPPPAIPGLRFLGYASLQDLAGNLLKLLQPIATAPAEDVAFTRINTSLLLEMNPLAADIYVRLSTTKFLKLFQRDDEFDENDLSRYRDQKKIDYLYIRREDCAIFAEKLVIELQKLLATAVPADLNANQTVESAVETIHQLIQKVGVTKEVQDAVNVSVQVAMKTMGDFPALGPILKRLNEDTGQYIGRHTMLLTNVSCAIAVCMDWYSDATFEKLTMASFLHDATLSDQDLCAVKDLSEFEKVYRGKFSQAQQIEYRRHPEKALMLLGQFKKNIPEVDKIIVQHHEHPMGSGFPAALSSNYISPLSSLFIVAHDLTDYIIDEKEKFNIDEFLAKFEKKYSSGQFKKIAKKLSEVELFETNPA